MRPSPFGWCGGGPHCGALKLHGLSGTRALTDDEAGCGSTIRVATDIRTHTQRKIKRIPTPTQRHPRAQDAKEKASAIRHDMRAHTRAAEKRTHASTHPLTSRSHSGSKSLRITWVPVPVVPLSLWNSAYVKTCILSVLARTCYVARVSDLTQRQGTSFSAIPTRR